MASVISSWAIPSFAQFSSRRLNDLLMLSRRVVLHPAKEELQKVVKDYMFFIQAHGSEYATRRLKELLATLEKL